MQTSLTALLCSTLVTFSCAPTQEGAQVKTNQGSYSNANSRSSADELKKYTLIVTEEEQGEPSDCINSIPCFSQEGSDEIAVHPDDADALIMTLEKNGYSITQEETHDEELRYSMVYSSQATNKQYIPPVESFPRRTGGTGSR